MIRAPSNAVWMVGAATYLLSHVFFVVYTLQASDLHQYLTRDRELWNTLNKCIAHSAVTNCWTVSWLGRDEVRLI